MKAGFFGQKVISSVPWVFAIAYLIPAPFIAGQSSEGWGYLILQMITFPAGMFFSCLHDVAHGIIFGNPVDPYGGTTWHVNLYLFVRFMIYIVGGTLWFFGVGLVTRWFLRMIFRETKTSAHVGK